MLSFTDFNLKIKISIYSRVFILNFKLKSVNDSVTLSDAMICIKKILKSLSKDIEIKLATLISGRSSSF